jgi:hypothetical protein
MIRSILALAVCLMLTACWKSDQRFFDSGDWARLDLSGVYEVASLENDNPPRYATLASRPDGLIEISAGWADDGDKPTLLGLVPITGGSGTVFLGVDRSTPGDGDIYYLARLTGDGDLGFYYPVCEATPAGEGLVVENGDTCTFTSEAALMRAALEADRFLTSKHIVAVTPFLGFSKSDEASGE